MKLKIMVLLCAASLLLTDASTVREEDSSEESSEEMQEERETVDENKGDVSANEGDKDAVDECANRCHLQSKILGNHNSEKIEAACTKGCKAQEEYLSNLELEHSATNPALLFGRALDKCWESCSANVLAEGKHCMRGCSEMKRIQASKVKKLVIENTKDSKLEANPGKELKNVIKSLKNEIFGNIIEDEENVNGEEEAKDISVPVWHVSYYVKRPSYEYQWSDVLNQLPSYEAQWNNMLKLFFNDFDGGREVTRPRLLIGKRGDDFQLDWPFNTESSINRAAAEAQIAEKETPSFYDQAASSLGEVKEIVSRAMDSPGFHENLFYILLGLTGILIISSAFNSVLCPKRRDSQVEEDHYYLPPGEALPVKLPSYDECIKADTDVAILEQEYKVNLSLPVVSLQTTDPSQQQEEGKKKDENQI